MKNWLVEEVAKTMKVEVSEATTFVEKLSGNQTKVASFIGGVQVLGLSSEEALEAAAKATLTSYPVDPEDGKMMQQAGLYFAGEHWIVASSY